METETEPCAICGDEMCQENHTNLNNCITLRCKHSYHYTCLMNGFKYKITPSPNLNIKHKLRPQDRKCPYCQQRFPLIPYKPVYIEFIEGVHVGPGPAAVTTTTTTTTTTTVAALTSAPGFLSNSQSIVPKCTGICKTGLPCNFKGKFNGYCGHHKPNINV